MRKTLTQQANEVANLIPRNAAYGTREIDKLCIEYMRDEGMRPTQILQHITTLADAVERVLDAREGF